MPLPHRTKPSTTELATCHFGVPMLSHDRCRPSPADSSPAFCMASFTAAASGQDPYSFRHTGRDSRIASCRRGVGVLLFWRNPHGTYDHPHPSSRVSDRLGSSSRVLLSITEHRVCGSPATVGRASLLRPRRPQGHAAGLPPLEWQAFSLQKRPEIDLRKFLLSTKS